MHTHPCLSLHSQKAELFKFRKLFLWQLLVFCQAQRHTQHDWKLLLVGMRAWGGNACTVGPEPE